MRLHEYLEQLNEPLKKMTISYPTQGDQVLLAKKVSTGGLGEGHYLGIGGKVEDGETDKDGARREIFEEVGLEAHVFQDMGKVCFYFPNKGWNFEVQIYLVVEWEGQPANSNEMEPKWFEISKIPFGEMWDDNKYWLPHVLDGKRIEAHFLYGDDNVTVSELSIRFLE